MKSNKAKLEISNDLVQNGNTSGSGAKKKGMGYGMSSFFLIAQMAGAGFLALPRAMADSGWLGVGMLVAFCTMVGYSGSRLGISWVILEERWEEYKKEVRQPYMEIGYRSLGIHGRRLTMAAVLISLTGSTTVYITLMAEFFNALIPQLNTCFWTLILGAGLLPFTWLGTPKDFWQSSVLAVVSTALACGIVFVLLFVEIESFEPPTYPNPTITSFALGFATILFSFSGASVFPTIQNDMHTRSDFWKSVIISFTVILMMYLPVAVAGYAIIGNAVESNILLSIPSSIAIQVAIIMEVINLIGTYVISFSPVCQAWEEIFNIPNKFGIKRVGLRSTIVIFEVIIGLAIPNFQLILNLIGGSTVTLCSLVLPPIMYMRLVDMKSSDDKIPTRTIQLWERVLLWQIVILGVIGGVVSTVSAIMAILDPEAFGASCFTDFMK